MNLLYIESTRTIDMKKLLLLILLIPNLVMAENVIYCADELATGILKDYEKGREVWKTSDFKLERHTINFNDNYTSLEGVSAHPMSCSKPYNHIPDYIACVHSMGSHETFSYNKLTKRFLYSNISSGGYVKKGGPDTESLSAGSCEAF